jgi:hypothetical protein
MKFVINRVIVALLLVTLASAAAFAKTRSKTISLQVDTNVNGTLIKRGTYKVVFDDQTNELSILKEGKVLVRTAARLEMRDRKANGTEVYTRTVDMGSELVGIAFSGSNQNVVVSQSGMQAGGN